MTISSRLSDLRDAARWHAAEGSRVVEVAAEHRRATVDLEAEARLAVLAIQRPLARPRRDGDPGSVSPARDELGSIHTYGVRDPARGPHEDAGTSLARWALRGMGEGLLKG